MVDVSGVDAFAAAVARHVQAAHEVSARAAVQAGHVVAAAAVAKLTQRSHPPGTPTPSPPGQPPATVGGALAASVTVTAAQRVGDRVSVRIGPTSPYGRIHELGGTAGHGSRLPARPYLGPALHESIPEVRELIDRAWAGLTKP